jgi:hypothetical protein
VTRGVGCAGAGSSKKSKPKGRSSRGAGPSKISASLSGSILKNVPVVVHIKVIKSLLVGPSTEWLPCTTTELSGSDFGGLTSDEGESPAKSSHRGHEGR